MLAAYLDVIEDAEGNRIYQYGDVWTSFAKDALMYVFLYAAIALVVVLATVALFVRRKKPESLKAFGHTALAFAVGFSIAIIVTMLSLEFYDMVENNYVFELVLWPSVVCAAIILLGSATVYVSSLYSRKAFKTTSIICGSLAGASIIALLVCILIYYMSGDAEYNNGMEITASENVLLYICAAVLIALVIMLAFLFGKKDKKGFDGRTISYAAVCIAMSFALSYISPIDMPQGGTVTIASLAPLMIYSYMFGTKKGVFAGAIYGLLQLVQDPWPIHPAQILLDYPIAFAGIGLAGCFAKVKALDKAPQVQIALGGIVSGVFRFVSHLFSGVFAFSQYAPDVDAWVYSLGYNATYVFPDIAIAIAVCIILFSSRAFVKQVRRFNTAKPAAQPAAEQAVPPQA